MARLFDDASSQYLKITDKPISAEPYTMACWFNVDVQQSQFLLCLSDASSTVDRVSLVAKAVDPWPVRLQYANSSNTAAAESTSAYSVNTWHHVCGVVANYNDLRVYLDGGNKGTSTAANTAVVYGNVDTTSIGALVWNNTVSEFTSGRVAEAAIWNVALNDDEAAALGDGYAPPLIRPGNLVAYWTLLRTDNDEWDGYHMTAQNSPTWGDHPAKIVYPMAPMIMMAPGVTVPPIMHYYRMRRAA